MSLLSRIVLGDTYLSWRPAIGTTGLLMLVGACALAWLLLRFGWGASQVRGRIGLWVLRAAGLGILALILLGPTMVDEQDGVVSRPIMMFLMDGSQSMELGQEQTRWDLGLNFLSQAETLAGTDGSDCQSFRFGHRLGPLRTTDAEDSSEGDDPSSDGDDGSNDLTLTRISAAAQRESVISPPQASDSRLGDALRQLLPQVSSRSSAGVVLLSDGRVRASETVEQLADYFGRADVPIHVVPLGQATGTGDIAIVSLVVPTKVRKYTENEVQVFLRSFGFNGSRTTVRVTSPGKIGGESTTVASIPVTLTGGAQSVSLKFRVNEHPEDLIIVIDPLDGELTERNNRVETRVDIDRTKIRVLYVGGDGAGPTSIFGQLFGTSRPAPDSQTLSNVRQALQADKDLECTVLISVGGSTPRNTDQAGGRSSFPRTRAELFAYDCVVFSDVAPDVLSEEQMIWLAQWIEGRGGGLIVTGGNALQVDRWKDSPLEPLLPLKMEGVRAVFRQPRNIELTDRQHPVWRLRLQRSLNDALLDTLPPLNVTGEGYTPKTSADILARQKESGEATMMAHRAGRGRVLTSTASLGGQALVTLAQNWGPQPERVAAKLWRNMVYWVTEGSSGGRRRLVAESDKRFYRPGEPLRVTASAYDEAARRTQRYRVWAMFEPASLEDLSIYSPILWPDNVVRDSGEVGPRIAWGEEMKLVKSADGDGYDLNLTLSETEGVGDRGLRIEMTAYEGDEPADPYDHGTQVDSTSLAIQILSDPFEQQNPLPNHELLTRVATVSGGQVLRNPGELAELLKNRKQSYGPPRREMSPAWSHVWLWCCLIGLLSAEWIWRRATGLA